MNDSLEFFKTAAGMTSLGDHRTLFDDLPRDIPDLCRVVQGLTLHIFWVERYGVKLEDTRNGEVQLRSVADKLKRIIELDASPLTQARNLEKRLVSNCRDISVLLTAILRHQGVPARARCGFARYFLPDHFEDHWVCEYWNASQDRWVLVDAQLDTLQSKTLGIRFDPCDVPRDAFIVGGKAWEMCRAGEADPDSFGIFQWHGMGFIRGNLVRDIASLNKTELLPWDVWGIMEKADDALSSDDLAALDGIARLINDDVPEFRNVQTLYENDVRWRVPRTIRSYRREGIVSVDLGVG